MGTTVNPLDGEFDLDDGIYLQHLDEYRPERVANTRDGTPVGS